MFSCVEILQCLLYEQYEQHQDSKVSKKDMKQTMTLLFLYNAEVRYTVQLRHLSNKTQSGYYKYYKLVTDCFFNGSISHVILTSAVFVYNIGERCPYSRTAE